MNWTVDLTSKTLNIKETSRFSDVMAVEITGTCKGTDAIMLVPKKNLNLYLKEGIFCDENDVPLLKEDGTVVGKPQDFLRILG